MKKVEIPLKIRDEEGWLMLNNLSNSGKIRAVKISKKRLVHDWDGHHCDEASVKSSIRYNPKKWNFK